MQHALPDEHVAAVPPLDCYRLGLRPSSGLIALLQDVSPVDALTSASYCSPTLRMVSSI
jgi:hypothetical protein